MSQLRIGVAVLTMGTRPLELDALLQSVAKQDVRPTRTVVVGNGTPLPELPEWVTPVELEENLEGLCHISELSEERVEKPEAVVQLGQEMDFKILRIDSEGKKIGLSARAVGKDEPIVDTKVYSSEAGGGMASLGELADFGIGRSAGSEEPEK